MSELPTRTADPTLFALGSSVDIILQHGALPPRAHRVDSLQGEDYVSACGLRSFVTHQAKHACWFAVPCRECFPDAPPPGTCWVDRPMRAGETFVPIVVEGHIRHALFDEGLAWQTEERT